MVDATCSPPPTGRRTPSSRPEGTRTWISSLPPYVQKIPTGLVNRSQLDEMCLLVHFEIFISLTFDDESQGSVGRSVVACMIEKQLVVTANITVTSQIVNRSQRRDLAVFLHFKLCLSFTVEDRRSELIPRSCQQNKEKKAC